MNKCCKDKDADLNKDGKVSIIEAIAWGKANNETVAADKPQGSLLGEDRKITFGSGSSFFKNSEDGGGTLEYEIKKFAYKIEKGGSNGEDSIVCRKYLYVKNHKGSPHVGTREVNILCKVKNQRNPVVLKTVKLRLNKKQRLCLVEIPENCQNVYVKKKSKKLDEHSGFVTVNGQVSGNAQQNGYLSFFNPGEYIYLPYELVDSVENQKYEATLDSIKGWNLNISPGNLTTHALIDTDAVIIRGQLPDSAVKGGFLSGNIVNTTTGDSSEIGLKALLYDSLETPLLEGKKYEYMYLILNYNPLFADSGEWFIDNSQVEIQVKGSIFMKEKAKLNFTNSNIFSAPESSFEFRNKGGHMILENSGIVQPISGLDVAGGSLEIVNSSVLFSYSTGLVLRKNLGKDFDKLSIRGLYLDRCGKSSLVVTNGIVGRDLFDVRIVNSQGRDIELSQGSEIRMIDSYYDPNNVSIGSNSTLTRSWTRSFRFFKPNDQPQDQFPFEIYDAMDNLVIFDTTDSLGFTNSYILTEYIQKGNQKTTFSPYYLKIRVNKKDSTIGFPVDSTDVLDIHLPDIIDSKNQLEIVQDLFTAYPNPFSESVNLRFEIDETTYVKLEITDVNGKTVEVLVEGKKVPSKYDVSWDPGELTNGIYFATLLVGKKKQVQKIFWKK